MNRKNKKRKPSQSKNEKQNSQPTTSNTIDTDSIVTLRDVQSILFRPELKVHNLCDILMKMKKNIELKHICKQNETPTDQPSTSQLQDTEVNRIETSNERKGKKNVVSRSARRRRLRKEKHTQRKKCEPPKRANKSNKNPVPITDNSKANKDALKKSSEINIKPENSTEDQIQAVNVENVPIVQNDTKTESRKSGIDIINLALASSPGSLIIKKITDKGRDIYFRKPDYGKCDYNAYDCEAVEKCAEKLGPNETIQITIDCTEFVPMFAEYVPIRHYFVNKRVVNIVQKNLLDSKIPPLPFPIEIFPDIVHVDKKADENKTATSCVCKEIKNNEQHLTINANADNPESNINKGEIESNTGIKSQPESRTSVSEVLKKVVQRILQIEKDLNKIHSDMLEFSESLKQMQKSPYFSQHSKEPNENGEVESVQLTQNRKTVIFRDQNIMKISSDCSKNENLSIPLFEDINIEQFAACTDDASIVSCGKKGPTSETFKPSLPNTTSKDFPDDSQTTNIMPKSDKNLIQHKNKTLYSSKINEAVVDNCVQNIVEQLKRRVKSNINEIVITEQPKKHIKNMRTIKEINNSLSKQPAPISLKSADPKIKLNDQDKINYREVISKHKYEIQEKLYAHKYCTCTKIKINPASPHLCSKGHRLCFKQNKNISNEQVASAAAEWSYLLKFGSTQDESYYKELIAKNTVEDGVIFLKHVEDEFIANGITVSSIPALRIESDREYEVDESDPAIRRAELLRQWNKRE